MYKKCAQRVRNRAEKPVRNFPQFGAVHSRTRGPRHVIRTLHNFHHIIPPSITHVLHSNFMQINRATKRVIRTLHTTYYYYY